MVAGIKGTPYGANIIGANLRRFYGIKRCITLMVAPYGANIIGADLRRFYGIKRRIILMVALGK